MSHFSQMTGVGIEPTTYGLKGTFQTAPNVGFSAMNQGMMSEVPMSGTDWYRKFRHLNRYRNRYTVVRELAGCHRPKKPRICAASCTRSTRECSPIESAGKVDSPDSLATEGPESGSYTSADTRTPSRIGAHTPWSRGTSFLAAVYRWGIEAGRHIGICP